jgi:aquaglyceroporin related protein, other eukaryote
MEAQDKFGKPNPHLDSHRNMPPRTGESSSSSPDSGDVTVTHAEDYPYHAEHGPPIDNALRYDENEEEYRRHKDLLWSRIRHHLRDPLMEFCGTMIMIIFGDGSVAQVVLSANPDLPKSSQNKGDYQSISWGYVSLDARYESAC